MANSVDSIVSDPPYGLSFMGKDWDHGVPGEHFWREALRVAKPGAHLLAFGGTRTFHRLAVAIEDAGWEIRDTIMWVYGSGFPKSLDVSKAIDKAAGAVREVIGTRTSAYGTETASGERTSRDDGGAGLWCGGDAKQVSLTGAPATDAARQWQGWGTALKPAWEPIIVARKPLEGTVAANVLKWGTGAINVDGCRVEAEPWTRKGFRDDMRGGNFASGSGKKILIGSGVAESNPLGRWPANLLHDGSQMVLDLFPVTTSGKPCGKRNVAGFATATERGTDLTGFGDSGSAARFFYCAKASKADRDEGCEGLAYVLNDDCPQEAKKEIETLLTSMR
jgi:site-specific DNA-methyltransferase (adenine-specific)